MEPDGPIGWSKYPGKRAGTLASVRIPDAMIDREQLAAALARLDPHYREVLDYSLRRRVPDEDLAAVFGATPAEVARLRATAVERLSNELGVQRGADLGHMLKDLLDAATWELVPAPPPEPAAEPEHASLGAAHSPPPVEPEAPPPHQPVLGMLAGDAEGPSEPSRRRGGRGLVAGISVAVAVLVPAGMVAALTNGGGDGGGKDANRSATSLFESPRHVAGDPFPTDPKSAHQYPVAYVRGRTTLLDSPGGKVKIKIPGRTDFDSPRALSVVQRRGEWLAVVVPELRNGEIGWIQDTRVTRLKTVGWALHVDLSRHEIVVRLDGKDMRRLKIGVGRATNPTPTGRFAVTDKLNVADPTSPYGCCVLALTGHQVKLPPGWPGGDQVAIHATRDLTGLGHEVSLGCIRTDPRDTRWMMKRIPLGAPVFIHA